MPQQIDPSTGVPIVPTSLTGSNVEKALGTVLPPRANLMGISDGTNIQALLGNTQGTLLASAARTAAISSPNQTNNNARGVIVTLKVTATPASPGTGGLVLSISGIEPVSGIGFQINPNPTAVTTAGLFTYVVYPGISSSSVVTQSISQPLPRIWYTYINALDAQSYTYSVGYSMIL